MKKQGTDAMVEIKISPGRRAGTFLVNWRGEVLISAARDPEHEAARLLLARGITGFMTTRWAGSRINSMRIDIEKAAGLSTRDGGGRLIVVPFEKHPGSIEDGREPRCGGWVAAPSISAAGARTRHQQMATTDRPTDPQFAEAISGAGRTPNRCR